MIYAYLIRWKGIQANYKQNDSYFEWSVYEALKVYSKFSSNEVAYNISNEVAADIINHNTTALTKLVQRVSKSELSVLSTK